MLITIINKKIFLVLLILTILPIQILAQTKENPGRTVIQIESGWNGYTGGLGPRLNFHLLGPFAINGGFGGSLWGFRTSGSLFYYIDTFPYGLALCTGYVHDSGMKQYEEEAAKTTSGYKDLNLKLYPTEMININIHYSTQLTQNILFYFEGGYAVRVGSKKDYKQITNYKITSEGKSDIESFSPGGIIISIGFGFGPF